MKFKDALHELHERAMEMEAFAREHIENKNLADIIAHGAGKLKQASEHPDTEKADDKLRQPPTFDPSKTAAQ